jgi:hypothetical protein
VEDGLIRTEVLDEDEQRRRAEIAETRGLDVFDPHDLERVEGGDGLLVFTGPGENHGPLLDPDRPAAWRTSWAAMSFGSFSRAKPLTPRFLVRADRVVGEAPATLTEWQERRDRKAAAVEASRVKQAAAVEAARKLAEPVTLDALAFDGATMTLREAGEVVHKAGGTIKVRSSRLVVSLPPGALFVLGGLSPAAKAARRLYAAEDAIVALAGRGGEVSIGKLPAKPILPSGRLAP